MTISNVNEKEKLIRTTATQKGDFSNKYKNNVNHIRQTRNITSQCYKCGKNGYYKTNAKAVHFLNRKDCLELTG